MGNPQTEKANDAPAPESNIKPDAVQVATYRQRKLEQKRRRAKQDMYAYIAYGLFVLFVLCSLPILGADGFGTALLLLAGGTGLFGLYVSYKNFMDNQ